MVRLVENIFLPSQIHIKAAVMPLAETTENDYTIAFAKVRYWLENIMSRSIAFNRNNQAAVKILFDADGYNKSGNLIMLTPDEPTDENMAILLQAKMIALASGKLGFGSVEIKSNNLTGLRFTFIGSSEEMLPSMQEWIGDHTYFDQPWWSRDDASTLDVIPAEDADLSEKPSWAYNLDFIEKMIQPKQDNVVLRPEFKPTVIDGGKNE
ncbi:unnamed protein product [Sphagnum tenellum]